MSFNNDTRGADMQPSNMLVARSTTPSQTTDGSIDISDRVDHEAKLKGFRVELDGVSATLNACSALDRAAVLIIDDDIHAFISPSTCDLDAIKKHVQSHQPYYTVPSHFHPLDSLPLTPDGKIDEKALRDLVCDASVEFSRRMTDENTGNDAKALSYASAPSTAHGLGVGSSLSSSSITEKSATWDLEAAVPDKIFGKHKRGLIYRVLIIYRRLFTLVGVLNIAAAIALVITGIQRQWMGTITATNLVIAVLIRQEAIINALYTIACSVPVSWPFWFRRRCARIYHLGGVHSGAAVSASLWMLASNLSDVSCMATADTCASGGWGNQSIAAQVVSWIITVLFGFMLASAYPTIRKKHHNGFERTHRFTGWTMLALFWVQVVLTCNDSKKDQSLGYVVLRTPSIWLLVVATMSIASSWFWLRKVPVEAEVLSDHAIRLHFDYTVPVDGSFVRLSRSPLTEWHSFATIAAPPKGFSLIVSNAGDWTRWCIQEKPKKIWIRGVPTCGVMRISTLFRRVVLVGTGSGIGPLLGHIQTLSCDVQLIWSTPSPEKTFGKDLCDTVRHFIPGSVIHDTKTLGRPDLVKMAYNMAKGFDAEAVIIIANEKITKKVVYGLETRGVPAYGAIWDS